MIQITREEFDGSGMGWGCDLFASDTQALWLGHKIEDGVVVDRFIDSTA